MNFYFIKMALYASLFTWAVTALGSLNVLFFKKISNRIMQLMFGFSSGVMLAASFFSLIAPGIEMSNKLNQKSYLIVTGGVLSGFLLILLFDNLLTKINISKQSNRNNILLILAITLHNIPEGLAIGVAFGSLMYNIEGGTILSAWLLAIGIGLQNFPEGMAVSIPLRNDGVSRKKSFFYGQLSGMVEPISAILGVILVTVIKPILPYVLGLAAGAMIYVVVEELIPSGNETKIGKLCTIGVIIGFIVMMFLDLALS